MTQKNNSFSLDKENIYHFGLDHLEIYATFLSPHLFVGLDFDNSNYAELESYIIVKHEVRKYECKYEFIHSGIPLFAYYIGEKKESGVSTRNYLCAYASAFRILGPFGVHEFIHSYFEPESRHKQSSVRRFDICMDILVNIDRLLEEFEDINQKGAIFLGEGGKTETRYIGEKCTTRNKRQLIRIYDKIRDILRKQKNTLYSDYLLQKDITRVEIEIRRELAQNIELQDLFDEYTLLRVFKNYLEKHSEVFKEIPCDIHSLYRKSEKIDYEAIQSRSYWEFRTKLLISYAKSIMKTGTCPVEILLSEGLIQERTKVGLGYEDYARYLSEIKHKEYWYRYILPLSDRNYDGDEGI